MAQTKSFGPTLYFSQFGGERPIPAEFIAAMDRAEERTAGFAADAEIPQSILADRNVVAAFFDTGERRSNEKVLVVIRKKEGNITLQDRRTTDQGQTVQVDATLFYKTDETFVRSFPSATQDVAVKDLGNGWSIQEVAVMGTFDDDGNFVPGIYQGIELEQRREDPVPDRFRVGLLITQTQEIVDGTVEAPTLGANDLSVSERQIAQHRKLLSTLTRDGVTLPFSLTHKRTNEQKQIVTITETYRLEGTAPEASALQNAIILDLGEGHEVVTTEVIDEVFAATEYATEIPVVFPTRHIAGIPEVTTSSNVEGTAATPTLTPGVTSKLERQLNKFVKRLSSTLRNITSWPVLMGQRIDRGVVVPYTEQVVAAGTSVGDDNTEIEPLSSEWSLKKVHTLTQVDAYFRVLHNTTNIDLPPELSAVTGYMEINGGSGSYSEQGFYSIGGNGSGGLSLQCNAQGSAAIVPEAGFVLKPFWGNNKPCFHFLCYMPVGATRQEILDRMSAVFGSTVLDWPLFAPKRVTLKCTGQHISMSLKGSISAHSSTRLNYKGEVQSTGESRNRGSGLSYETGVNVKIIHIPESIHPALTIGGSSLSTTTCQSQCSMSTGAAGEVPVSTGVITSPVMTGSIIVVESGTTTVPATPGNTQVMPTSGLRLHRLVSEPDNTFNRIRVFAEVVDFAFIR